MSPPLHTHGVDFGDVSYESAGLELPVSMLPQCCISQQVAECSLPVPASTSFCAAVQLTWDGPHYTQPQLVSGSYVCWGLE